MLLLEFALNEIAHIAEPAQIPHVLARIGNAYGMTSLAYLGTGTLDRTVPKEPYFAVTYSKDWVQHYRSRGYVKIDPVIRTGLRRVLPIDWDELHREEATIRQLFGEAAEFGVGRRGISFPVHGHSGDRALLSVSGDFKDSEWQGIRRLSFQQFPVIATYLHDAVLRTAGVGQLRQRLSPREIECLGWASEGKTVWECGVILGLSPHTVKCYLESARYKLRASSNTHAVSIALKRGLLCDFS